MKRLVALLMILALLCGVVLADEVPQNYKDLRDKLYRQLLLSGLRGVARFTFEGDAEWAKPFQPISDALINFQTLTTRDGHTELEAYISKNGTSTARTRLWGDGTNLYLRSALLIDTVLQFPWRGDYYSSLTAQGTENPDYLSAILNALIHDDDWEAITAPLRTEIENWLMRYAETPEQTTEDGQNLLSIRYRISANDIKAEMKNLLRIALNDEDIYRQVHLYLNEEQLLLGFSEANLAYEDRVIDTLPIADGITVERLVNTRGDTISTEISLPLVSSVLGWNQITIRDEKDTTYVNLVGEEQLLSVSIQQTMDSRGSGAWKGTFEYQNADGETLRASWTADWTFSESKDDDTLVSHEVTIVNFRAEPTPDSDIVFSPVNLYGSVHMYSDFDQRHATTTDIEVIAQVDGEKITFNLRLLPTNEYDIREMDITGAIDATTLSSEKRAEIGSDMLVNMLLNLALLDAPSATPTPEDEPEEEPTMIPTPEPSPSPTPTLTPTPSPSPTPSPTPEPTLPTIKEITEIVDLDEEDEP